MVPWTRPHNPNNFDIRYPPHYIDAPHRNPKHIYYKKPLRQGNQPALARKTLDLDAITSKLIKHLPEEMHTLTYTLFLIMVKHKYTPNKLCRSATYLLYKPSKNTSIT
jgi:hypothetical protein